MTDTLHPNLAILQKLDIKNLDGCAELFADRFVWHYFNPQLPDMEGDYRGVSGLQTFFAELNHRSGNTFHVHPVDARAVGDELVFVQVRNGLTMEPEDGGAIEFDAIVVWRFVDGKIAEAWDIPAVYTAQAVHDFPVDA